MRFAMRYKLNVINIVNKSMSIRLDETEVSIPVLIKIGGIIADMTVPV